MVSLGNRNDPAQRQEPERVTIAIRVPEKSLKCTNLTFHGFEDFCKLPQQDKGFGTILPIPDTQARDQLVN